MGAASASATIADDDPVVVTGNDVTADATTDEPSSATFTISAGEAIPAGQSITVPWSVQSGTTSAGEVTGSGAVTLSAAHPSAAATVTIAAGDYAQVGQFRLVLGTAASSPAGRTVLVCGGAGVIAADSAAPATTSPASGIPEGGGPLSSTSPPAPPSTPSTSTSTTAPSTPTPLAGTSSWPATTAIVVGAAHTGSPPSLARTGIDTVADVTLAALLILTGLTTLLLAARRRASTGPRRTAGRPWR